MQSLEAMEGKYLNFPVQLLQDAFKDIRQTMNNILDYAGYKHTLQLHGNSSKKMEDAGKYFGVSSWGDTMRSYRNGETLHDTFVNSPMAGINKEKLWDFYNNSKTPDEIAVLLAFLAIKSIIGVKPYCRVTNGYLLARMGGYAGTNDLPHPLPEPLAQYNTRRKLDKIKKELQLNWNVNIYGTHTRGFYVSIDNRFDMNKLAFEAEKRRKSTKEKQLKQRKDEARRKALEKLDPDKLGF